MEGVPRMHVELNFKSIYLRHTVRIVVTEARVTFGLGRSLISDFPSPRGLAD
jgi:hypothetical protein